MATRCYNKIQNNAVISALVIFPGLNIFKSPSTISMTVDSFEFGIFPPSKKTSNPEKFFNTSFESEDGRFPE